jgi:hypothetical protein
MRMHPERPRDAPTMKHFPCLFSARGALAATALLCTPRQAQVLQYPVHQIFVPQKIYEGGGSAQDSYGSGLAVRGDTLAIGIPNEDDAFSNSGSVHLHARTQGPGSWGFVTELHSFLPQAGASFGTRVALAGNALLVSAPRQDEQGSTDCGAVFIYDAATLQYQSRLLPFPLNPGCNFGSSLAVDAVTGRCVVGAPSWDSGVLQNVGRAFLGDLNAVVFTLDGAGVDGDQFGAAVAIEGDYCAVGATDEDFNAAGGISNSGAVYVHSSANGVLLYKLTPPTPATSDRFGSAIHIQGGKLAVTSPGDDVLATNAGAVYVYDVASGTLLQTLTSGYLANIGFPATVRLADERLYVGTPLSANQSCGGVLDFHWGHGYQVAYHQNGFTSGVCGEKMGYRIALDAGTLFSADPSGTGASLLTGCVWRTELQSVVLTLRYPIGNPITPLQEVRLRPGKVGWPCGIALTAVDGAPVLPPIVLTAGLCGPTGERVLPLDNLPAGAANHTFTLMGGAFDEGGLFVLTNSVDYQILP